ncbi:MAG: Calx-beta domain-containing protein [Chloroflexota bacterium]
MKRINSPLARFSRLLLIFLGAISLFSLLLYSTSTAHVAPLTEAGFLDFSYGENTANDPTGEKPESKIWWNDGFWWGSLFNETADEYRIYRLHWPTQTWEDTGTTLDNRPNSKADTLWDEENQKLYVVSHVSKDPATHTNDPAEQGRLYRYSYNKETRTYSLDAGFPVNVNEDKTETLVLTKDSTGRLWVAYISTNVDDDQVVFVNSTTGGTLAHDASWNIPFELPFAEATVAPGDIASITAYNNNGTPSVAVVWSNQNSSSLHIALHGDIFAQDMAWFHIEPIIPNGADDHISVSTKPTATGDQLFIVIKTAGGLNNDSLIGVVARDSNGVFSYHSYSRVVDKDSRPTIVVDEENNELYVIVSERGGGRIICYKKATITSPLNQMVFPTGNCGTTLIADELIDNIDNATTIKQNVNNDTGLVVLGSDHDNGFYYVHNFITEPAPTVINTNPTDDELDVAQDSTISVAFSKQMDETTLDDSTMVVEDQFGNVSMGAVGYISETQTAVFTPTNPLSASSQYTVSLTSGIQDMNGQQLLPDENAAGDVRRSWNFSTVGPRVALSSNIYEFFEDDGVAGIEVTLNAPSGVDVMVDINTSDGTAVSGQDYSGISQTVTIPAGQQSIIVDVPLINNDVVETAETFNVALSNPVDALLDTPNSAFVQIIDDEGLPRLSFAQASYNVDETDSNLTVEIVANPATVNEATVDVTMTGGTATNGSDYNFSDILPLTIPAGSSSMTFTITFNDDLLFEGMESIELSLSNPMGDDSPRLGDVVSTTINIADDEPVPTVVLNTDTYTTTETAVSQTVTALLDTAADVAVSVDYAATDGTAEAGSDYTIVTGTLTFAPGETLQSFDLPILDDALNEATETAIVTLSNPVLVNLGTPMTATVHIEDDDALPMVMFSEAETAVAEDSGTVTVTLTLSEPSGRPVEVSYAPTMSGTATAGSDYDNATGSVIFPALSTSQTISVTINDDTTDEPEEDLILEITNADFATIGAMDTHTVTITDNDDMPSIAFADVAYEVNEGDGVAVVTVQLSNPSEFEVTVDIASAESTATSNQDYTEVAETITFAPGTVSQTVSVMLIDDEEKEPKESFLLLLSNPTNALLANNDTTVTIVDNDELLIFLPIIRRAP